MIIVLAVLSYDKARGMMETFTMEFPERFGFNLKFVSQLFCAFITPEYSMPSIVVKDITKLMRLVNSASKIFRFSSIVFQSGIRMDLLISYTFARITDDMIDDKSLHIEEKKPKLKLFIQFLDELFAGRKSDYDVKKKPYIPKINWPLYQSQFTDVQMSCCRAFSRIAFYLPRKPFYELLEGYKWDVERRLIRNEKDLMEYCNYVAGSSGAISIFTFMYRSDNGMNDIVEKYDNIVEKSQQLARDLQLVNIARDIIYDSVTVGRTYIPTSFLDDEETELKVLCDKKDARSLGMDLE
ncbi:bifunctional lycopene cyclase/phytoene synthase-like isoform X2 [Sipha flava]|nr:bifunctional lycopene cyclase/phytoene synthase-like isoform X2 [Sipha flava]